MRSLEGTTALALDTESDSFFHYFEKVCLLQICDDKGQGALVDPIAFQDFSALAPIMANPAVEKILHGADNDIMLLKRDFKFEFASVFDTQVGARFAGRLELGLQSVLHKEFDVNLSKALQRCDWSRRPLSRPQELYAVEGLAEGINSGFASGRTVNVTAARADGSVHRFLATVRIDTPQEIRYYQHGGILPYVLRQLLAGRD